MTTLVIPRIDFVYHLINTRTATEVQMVGHYYNRITVKPPINGSFPLDIQGKCTFSMEKYLECIREANYNNQMGEMEEKCKDLMQLYLECRKQNDLS